MNKLTTSHISYLIILFKLTLIASVLIFYLPQASASDLHFDTTFLWFLLAGFLAQLVDGSLGMAYGVTSNAVLLGFGLSPKLASAAVHTAEVFTTGASGLSHIRVGNFSRALFLKLLIPGVLAAALGAYILGALIDGEMIKPYISAYLLVLGFIILLKAFRKKPKTQENLKHAPYFAMIGGFLDAIGGGGWGPIVSSNLIRQGNTPHIVIGTVNTVEFFVTFVSAGVLIFFTGIQSWQIILGLIGGGLLAAPLGAVLAKKVSSRPLMIIVGVLIMLTSTLTIVNHFY